MASKEIEEEDKSEKKHQKVNLILMCISFLILFIYLNDRPLWELLNYLQYVESNGR